MPTEEDLEFLAAVKRVRETFSERKKAEGRLARAKRPETVTALRAEFETAERLYREAAARRDELVLVRNKVAGAR